MDRYFQALDLILKPVCHAATQNLRDILIQLAFLVPQRRCRHYDSRLDVPEVQHHLGQLRAHDLSSRYRSLADHVPALHH
jgi:hypothetical protein